MRFLINLPGPLFLSLFSFLLFSFIFLKKKTRKEEEEEKRNETE